MSTSPAMSPVSAVSSAPAAAVVTIPAAARLVLASGRADGSRRGWLPWAISRSVLSPAPLRRPP